MVKLNISKLLENAGRTRYWLVNELKSSYPVVDNLINNTNTAIKMDTIDKLLKSFKCTPNDLFIADNENDGAQREAVE